MSKEIRSFLALDTDGTICKSSLLEAAIKASIEEGLFDARAFTETFRKKIAWQEENDEEKYVEYLNAMVGAFVVSMAGVEELAFSRIIDSVVRDQLKRRFAFPKRVIAELKPTHELIGISGSPLILVRPYLEDLGINHVFGSDYEVVNGIFTGRARSVGSKALILQTLVERGIVTQSSSVAIGDTISDESMFSYVSEQGRPIMFNPSLTLKEFGAPLNWDCVYEVKDNITPLVRTSKSSIYQEVPLGEYLDSLRPAA